MADKKETKSVMERRPLPKPKVDKNGKPVKDWLGRPVMEEPKDRRPPVRY